MSDLAPRVPINGIKRIAVFAIRDFPKGCGPKGRGIKEISKSNPRTVESASTANDVHDEATFKSKEEIRASNLNDSEISQVGHAKREISGASDGAKFNGKVVEEVVEEEKSANDVHGEAIFKSKDEIGASNPNDLEISQAGHAKREILDSSDGAKFNGKVVEEEKSANDVHDEANFKSKEEIRALNPNDILDASDGAKFNGKVVEEEKSANDVHDEATFKSKEEIRASNPNDSEISQVGNAKREILDASDGAKFNGKVVEEEISVNGNIGLEEKLPNFKRRKVWAVRDFPAGCGRGAPKVEKGPIPSSESRAISDDMEVGTSSKSKAFDEVRKNGESFEKGVDEGLVTGTVQETHGVAAVKASKVTGLSGDVKKNKHAKRLEDEVKRNESHQRRAEFKEASREAKVMPAKAKSLDVEKNHAAKQEEAVESSERVSLEVEKNDGKEIKHNAQKSISKGRVKPISKNSSSENIGEDRSSSEKMLAGCDAKQTGKDHQNEELQDARVPSEFKIVDKVGQSMAANPVDKGSISIPKDDKKKIIKRKSADDEGIETVEAYGNRLIVHALMSAENCPWRKGRKSGGVISHSYTPKTKSRKVTKSSGSKSASLHKNIADAEDDEDSLPQDGANENAIVTQNTPYELCVTMTPSAPSRPISEVNSSNEEVVNRNMVKKALRLFQLVRRKLLQVEESSKEKEAAPKKNAKRADLDAARILKDNNEWVNFGNPTIGHVPGVEVGDEFNFRVELSIIGIHRPFQGGIDYMKKNGVILATSIVASGGYPDDVDNSDVLIYSGSGGNASGSGGKQAGDQKLERGNLALKNSIDAQTPVRVVYGSKELGKSDSYDAKPKMVSTFTYDGLYIVEKYWPESGTNNFIVFKFQLRRMQGQPETALKEIKKAKKSKVREGLCVKDISNGKESIPICAVNTIDNELPMPFKYINKVIYPSSYVRMAPKGCNCMEGCLNSDQCACAIKNGGEIPYNFNGAIVQAKVLVHECGPSCKCPPSCPNRVSQHGIKLPLEIFKTSTRGWGVRSLYSIPSGTFVCEYIGEMLPDAEAEQRVNDEYLFDIGQNYEDHTLWDGLPSFIPGVQSDAIHETVEGVDFTIDAAECGNVGRFINHSCSPNLYAQNVLYDHDEKKMPHVMFFAIDNIPPLQELTYHYNYALDQVRDSEGNIKKKECLCGSPECTGRLY